MAFEFFKVPVHSPGAFAGELNAFIAGHKVASIRKKFVDCGENSFWAICVDYQLHGEAAATASNANASRNRIDYKTILPAEDWSGVVWTGAEDWLPVPPTLSCCRVATNDGSPAFQGWAGFAILRSAILLRSCDPWLPR